MALIHLLQIIADAVAVDRVLALVLFGCALVTAVYGWRGARDHLHRGAGGVMAVMVFSTFLLLRPRAGAPMSVVLIVVGVVVVLLIYDVLRPDRPHEQLWKLRAESSLSSKIWTGAAVVLLLIFLFADLGGYPGWLMVWESSVTEGFAEAFYEGKTLSQYLLTCLAWNNGLVSNGHLTLLYGVLTYGLWFVLGISPLTLRLAASVLALACLIPAWYLARRLGTPRIAAVAVIVLSVNPALIFYGRYGVSLSGTLLGVSVAILTCVLLVDNTDVRWWHGLLTGVAVFVATLGYSPGRLVVVSALAMIPILLLRDRRNASRQRWVASFLLLAMVAAGWILEAASERSRFFFWARGEQIVAFMNNPERIEDFLGREVDPEDLTLADRVELVGRVFERTVPELIDVWSYPFSSKVTVISVVQSDPPRLPLFPPALAVFVLWGVIAALRRPLAGPHPFLFAWTAAVCLPLLLTTRVDVHRLMLTIVPLSLWAALGIQRASRTMMTCRVPAGVRVGCAALLLVGVAAGNSRFLYHQSSPPIRLSAAVLTEIEKIKGSVRLVFDTDHRDLGRVELPLLDRQRHRDERYRVTVYERERIDLLRQGGPPRAAINGLLEDLEHSSLILAPAEKFHVVAWALDRRRAHIVERGPSDARFWRVDRRGAPPPHKADGPSPKDPFPVPTPVRFDRPRGSQNPVNGANGFGLTFGFAPPGIDKDWEGRPIVMGGVAYDHGIGMHAWTRMTFEVPAEASDFFAIIGLSDRVRDCEAALVVFEVRGDDDRVLFESAPVGQETPPMTIQIPVAGERKITLILTDGGNGRDCDHGNWAAPAFLLTKR